MGGGLDADSLSWAALLAQCTDYARATAALGDAGEERRWREGAASVVALHAVTFALRQLDRVDEEERPVARDRAAVLIREHAGALDGIWRGVPMPDGLLELQEDASRALERSAWIAAVEMIWTGPGSFVVPDPVAELPGAIERGDEPARGTLLVMQPGTIVMPGEPVAWWAGRAWPDVGPGFDALEARDTDAPRQVYRQLDDDGRIVRDVLAPIWHEPQPGMPLLVPLLDDGRPVGRFTVDAATWEGRQRACMDGDPDEGQLPVEEVAGSEGAVDDAPPAAGPAPSPAPAAADPASPPSSAPAPSPDPASARSLDGSFHAGRPAPDDSGPPAS